MSEWQLIKTAPLDGTSVLVYCPDVIEPKVVIAQYLIFDGDPDGGQWWDLWNEEADSLDSTPPTHWMPLPEPPSN